MWEGAVEEMGKAIRSASMNGSSEVFTWGLSIRGVVLWAVFAMGAAEAAANTLPLVTYPAEVRETMGTSRAAVTVGRDAALGAEAYRLSVTSERIAITCAANAGHEVVMCPHRTCYLDYPTAVPGDPCPYPRFCETTWLPLEKVYSLNPLDGIPPEQHRFILGTQTLNWGESTWCESQLTFKMWPRTCVNAEIAWSGPGARTYADFKARLDRLAPRHAYLSGVAK